MMIDTSSKSNINTDEFKIYQRKSQLLEEPVGEFYWIKHYTDEIKNYSEKEL